ncbi:hypothetical protein ACQRC6_08245 [Peptoniphilus sp. SGI.035]|uniref:hypothetical protein n=1 Tax=Peptoniphilus sp. SGI.035 TaxID=3420564 RepID=UPI003CFE8D8E
MDERKQITLRLPNELYEALEKVIGMEKDKRFTNAKRAFRLFLLGLISWERLGLRFEVINLIQSYNC